MQVQMLFLGNDKLKKYSITINNDDVLSQILYCTIQQFDFQLVLLIIDSSMFEPDRESSEYQLSILSVKMKVKFPCRMKIQHEGSLITGEAPPSDDHRYIFNQEVLLRDETYRDCFELTVSLLTDKGAKYNAGVIKLYKAQLMRSEGQRLVLSLSKCIDSQAFAEVRVDQVSSSRPNRNAPYDRKSTLQRQIIKKNPNEADLSPYRNNPIKVLESKSQYQFPLHHNGIKHDWDTKSRSRLLPPQTTYQKSKIAPKVNYAIHQSSPFQGNMGQSIVGREKALEAEVYREGYQKLKQKYKKEVQTSKQELNKRLALQNTQNNLKLELMRLKLRVDEQQKMISDKNNKMKDLQTQVTLLQQKQLENGYLREELNKKQGSIKGLQDKIRTLNRNIDELRQYATDRSSQEANRVKQLQVQLQTMRIKLESKQREYERQYKARSDLLHQKQIQIASKKDSLDRQRKTVADLEKALQNKNYQMEKLLQNERNSCKSKIQETKNRLQRVQRDAQRLEDEKKDHIREVQQLKSNILKLQYDKRILSQQLQSSKSQAVELRGFKERYSESLRDHRTLIQQKTHLQRQLERTVQAKQYNLSQINKQFQEQVEYYKRANRDLDEKSKNLSNKLIEIQGQLQISRNQQDKLRRNLESSVKEATDSKEKEKAAKKALRNKQQQSLTVQSQLATLKQKIKSLQQIGKLQVDKVRQQSEKIRFQLENELDRVQELTQSNNQLNMEVNRLKIKLQYAQEKNEKDSHNLKEKQQHIQSLIKDYQEQVSTLDQTINSLRVVEKQNINKIQKYQIDNIKNEEKIEKAKKQIKILQEKCINYQNILKSKISQNQGITAQRESLSKRISQLQGQISILKSQNISITNNSSKYEKMSQIFQEEIKKAKVDIANLNNTINLKQKNEQQLRNQIKLEKEQYAKLDLKLNNHRKQTDRYRQSLNDAIQKYLLSLPLTGKQQIKRSFDELLSKKTNDISFADAISLIISQSKETKQALNKHFEQIKQLQRQNERAREQASQSSNKYQSSQSTLKRQIQELQKDLTHILEQKQAEAANNVNIIAELDERVKSLQLIEQQLNTQIQQLNFTINSLRMDYEAMNEQNSKKILNLRKLNSQQQEKIQYQLITISDLDQRCSSLQADIDHLQATIENQIEASSKKDKLIQELKIGKDSQDKLIDQLKRQKKDLLQKAAELELHLNTEREYKQKTKTMLEEQEGKANQLKNFISNLMKQKQAAIKSELQRSQSLNSLQGSLLDLNKELQLLKQQNQRISKTLDAQKQQNKKLNNQLKQLDTQKKEDKGKLSKLQEKLRQKEKDILIKDENIKKTEQKYQKIIQRIKLQAKQLQQELQFKNNTSLQSSKQTNQKIISYQTQLQKKSAIISNLQIKISQLEEQYYEKQQKIIQLNEILNKIKTENDEFKIKISEMDINFNQITDDTKDKEEKLFQFSGKIYNLQLKIQAKQRQKNERLQMLNQQWINKFQGMCEQYEQRLELVQKQRDYFKGLFEDRDREVAKLAHQIKNAEANEMNIRKMFEEKIKKLEEEKLSLFSIKNNEIQRLVEETKGLAQILKQRQTELRRLTNELQVARKTITNLDSKSKEYDEKIKSINKAYQTELQQLKKKDSNSKAYKEAVNNHFWNIEREIKKSLQNFIKNFLEMSDDKNAQKLVELIRGLEKIIMEILSSKPSEK